MIIIIHFLLQRRQRLRLLSPHGNYFCDKKSGEFIEPATAATRRRRRRHSRDLSEISACCHAEVGVILGCVCVCVQLIENLK